MRLPGRSDGRTKIQVLLDRADIEAGETLRGAVRITGGAKDMAIAEAHLYLICENEYEWRESTTTTSYSGSSSTSSTTTSTRTAVDRKVVAEQRLLQAGVVGAGTVSEHILAIAIPADAAPSARGKITRVRWKIEATLARRWTRDVSYEAPIEVLSTAHAAGPAVAEEVDSHGQCELSFRLDQHAFAAGESITGTLVLLPLRECRFNEVRVELERQERVDRGLGNEARAREAVLVVAESLELVSGSRNEYDFRIEVPPEPVPTLRTSQSAVRWRLNGIGARRLRSDCRGTREVFVYSAPPGIAEPRAT